MIPGQERRHRGEDVEGGLALLKKHPSALRMLASGVRDFRQYKRPGDDYMTRGGV
jgi:hypothetical protein